MGKFIETQSRLVVAKEPGEGEMGSDCFMDLGFPFEVMKIFQN